MIFRVAAVLLGITGFAVFNFGVDVCNGIGACGDVPVSSRGFLPPREVQFVMLLTSIVGMFTALLGLVRGPNELIPARIARPLGRIEEGEPLGVRGALLFGASAVLIGMIVPLHGLASPIPVGRALIFYGTIGAALALVAYFGWHLGTNHGASGDGTGPGPAARPHRARSASPPRSAKP